MAIISTTIPYEYRDRVIARLRQLVAENQISQQSADAAIYALNTPGQGSANDHNLLKYVLDEVVGGTATVTAATTPSDPQTITYPRLEKPVTGDATPKAPLLPAGDGTSRMSSVQLMDELARILATKDANAQTEALAVANGWLAAERRSGTAVEATGEDLVKAAEANRRATVFPDRSRAEAFGTTRQGRKSLFQRFLRQQDPEYEYAPPLVQLAQERPFSQMEATYSLDPSRYKSNRGGPTDTFEEYIRQGRTPYSPEEIEDRFAAIPRYKSQAGGPRMGLESALVRNYITDPEGSNLAYEQSTRPFIERLDPALRDTFEELFKQRYNRMRLESPGLSFVDMLARMGGRFYDFGGSNG